MQLNFQVREITNGIIVGYNHPYEVYGPDGANGREVCFKDFPDMLENVAALILEAWSDQKRRVQEIEEAQKKAGYMAKGAAVGPYDVASSVLGSPYMQPVRRGDDLDPRVVHGTEPASLNEQRQSQRMSEADPTEQTQETAHWRDKMTAKHLSADDMGDDAQEYDPVKADD